MRSENFEWDFFVFIFVVCFILVVSLHGIQFIWSRISPPSAESVWVKKQARRCDAMRSRFTYTDGVAECWRTPFMRRPKKMFSLRYKEIMND